MVNKITSLSIGVLAAIIIIMTSSAMAFEKKDNAPFRFEDYKSEEEAQAALLKLHPVGSDIQLLRKTLEYTGASCSLLDLKSQKVKELLNSDVIVRCDYVQKKFFFTYQWVVLGAQKDTPSLGIIKEIKVMKALSII